MLIYFVGVHRDIGEAVEEIVRTKPISIMSAYEYFRNRKKVKVDRGFKLICKLRKRNKGNGGS